MVRTVRDLNRQSWEAILIEWAQSGLSKKAFSTQRGISYKCFLNWCGRNKDLVARIPVPATSRRAKSVGQQLIPVHVVAGDPGDLGHPSGQKQPYTGNPASAPITITTPAGLRLHVEDGFNEQTLLRVLRALKEAA